MQTKPFERQRLWLRSLTAWTFRGNEALGSAVLCGSDLDQGKDVVKGTCPL